MTREEAVKAIKSHCYFANLVPVGKEALDMAIKALEQEPCCNCIEFKRYAKEMGFEIEREPCEDAISRKGLISKMEGVRRHYYKNGKIDGYKNLPTEMKIRIDEVDYLIGQIEDAPPVQPKYNTSEWCHDCSEYDHDKHCCPRFNRVIRNAVEEVKKPKTGHWIPVKFRPLTDEEQEEYPDYCYMADCPMPDDGEEILVSTKNGRVEKDECGFDDGYYLDSGYDWQTDIVAWMPLPEPYKAESEVGVNGNKKYITQK